MGFHIGTVLGPLLGSLHRMPVFWADQKYLPNDSLRIALADTKLLFLLMVESGRCNGCMVSHRMNVGLQIPTLGRAIWPSNSIYVRT